MYVFELWTQAQVVCITKSFEFSNRAYVIFVGLKMGCSRKVPWEIYFDISIAPRNSFVKSAAVEVELYQNQYKIYIIHSHFYPLVAIYIVYGWAINRSEYFMNVGWSFFSPRKITFRWFVCIVNRILRVAFLFMNLP